MINVFQLFWYAMEKRLVLTTLGKKHRQWILCQDICRQLQVKQFDKIVSLRRPKYFSNSSLEANRQESSEDVSEIAGEGVTQSQRIIDKIDNINYHQGAEIDEEPPEPDISLLSTRDRVSTSRPAPHSDQKPRHMNMINPRVSIRS